MDKQVIASVEDIDQPYYSSGLLARSLVRAGFPRYKAYHIAHDIWDASENGKNDEKIIIKKVLKLLKTKYPDHLVPFKQWHKTMKQTKPIIVLIGGGTGIGTSTLAVRLAWLLEINQVMGTDSIREVVRQFLPKEIEPLLNVSTFETGNYVKVVKSHKDAVIYGFLSQSKKVIYGTEAIIKRCIKESTSIILEGVHLVPGEMEFLKQYESKAIIVQILLDVKHPEEHKKHFLLRYLQNANRPKDKYLQYFKEIRLIRDFLVQKAEKNNVALVENNNLNKAEKEIIKIVYKAYQSSHK